MSDVERMAALEGMRADLKMLELNGSGKIDRADLIAVFSEVFSWSACVYISRLPPLPLTSFCCITCSTVYGICRKLVDGI